jgi:hypothetical protein
MTEILPVTKQDVVPKFKLSEIGIAGLRMFGGVSVEEFHSELQWPKAANTYKKMMCSVPISGSLMLYQNLSSKVSWRVKPVKDATEEETKQAEFIEECLNDMETPFRKVVQDALSSNVFGFAILEKVYRRRNKSSGSIYNDNKIACRKSALREERLRILAESAAGVRCQATT